MKSKIVVQDSLFIVLLAACCHLLFSKYGFNPTDEGFVLSASNRLLNGQLPHIDFSSVRPLGYAYLHIPELLFSKNHFFLISRFVFWIEMALIAFFWINFIENRFPIILTTTQRYSLILITFIFNTHYFPNAVLHTIDGLLMCLIGLNFIANKKKIGFLFLGFAALCKQNYAVLLFAGLLLTERKDLIKNSVIWLLPIGIYVGYVSFYGGWKDLFTQLSGHNELVQVGIIHYIFNYFFIIGVIMGLIVNRLKVHPTIYITALLLFAAVLLITSKFHGNGGFLFPGIVLSMAFKRKISLNNRVMYLITFLLSWSVSISVGYNSPALFIGGLLSFILVQQFYPALPKINNGIKTTVLLLFVLFCFVRTSTIYRDASASHLKYKLDNIVEGAHGIYTNKNTFDVLLQLDSLKKVYPAVEVVPDFTACNVLHSHTSKIKTEWPNKTEIPNYKILEKVTSALKHDSTTIWLIPIFQTALLKDGFTPQKNNGRDYLIVNYIRGNYPKVTYSSYFEIRKK